MPAVLRRTWTAGWGVIVLEATSGMNLPLKVGPMLSLADMAVVTKIDRVSQAEREVFRARIQDVAPRVMIREVNALHGIGIDPLVAAILDSDDVSDRSSSAAIRPWAPARFASARRISAGNRTSAWSGAGEPDVLSGRMTGAASHLFRQRRHDSARP